ncbi:hypothetical protein M3Y97_00332400 [Aphelenchoides bicaudatus]|nr:hypothetical protein M3Y97_00332400 [Aphelenchoides bicaudatus]
MLLIGLKSVCTKTQLLKAILDRENLLLLLRWLTYLRPVYVEEDYLEEEEEDFDEPLDSRHPDPNRPSSHLIRPEEVVTVLEAEKAKNIEVVECTNPNSPYQFLIIASPYNERHGQALIETVRRYFCRKYYFGKMNPRKKVEANGWYALDFHNSVLHIMKDHLRQKYNLAKVWSEEETENAEEEIDPEMFPTPKDDDPQVASHRRAVPIIKANS